MGPFEEMFSLFDFSIKSVRASSNKKINSSLGSASQCL